MGKLRDAKNELDALLEEFGCVPITESDFDTLIEIALGDLALNEAPTPQTRATPLLEAQATRIIVPKKGKVINEDGLCELAIMRPCISRGRRLRGLPPLYEQQMLARSAGVFKNWPMFQDHLPPEVMEAMVKKGRSVNELGGRVVESWYDPEFTSAEDDEYGYWKGAIRGRAIPQDPIARMIERDPDVLHCSINAWPTSARPKTHEGTKAMAVEGIRPRPIGSVDWVIRGGAGGRVLREDERAELVQRAVTFLGEAYTSRHMSAGAKTPDFSKMTAEELRDYLKENAPNLVPALREEETDPEAGKGKGNSTAAITATGLTEERVTEIVSESIEGAVGKLTEAITSTGDRLEERAQEIVTEREGQRELADRARKIIEAAVGITPKMRADLLGRYRVLPSGATQAIQLCESEADDETTADKVLERMLEADIEHCQEIVREAQGRPPVRKQGGDPGAGSGAGRAAEVPYWRRMAVAEGVLEKPEEAVKMFGDLPGGEN